MSTSRREAEMRSGLKETPSTWGTQGIVSGSLSWSSVALELSGDHYLLGVHGAPTCLLALGPGNVRL